MRLKLIPSHGAGQLAAAALVPVMLAVAALTHAQTSLPPKMRGPVPSGSDQARLLRGQKAYVLADCHLCHGATLAEARGGGADLVHSRVVEMDIDGSMIGPVVRAGLPRTQTAMPSYPDMPQAQLDDLIAYVHFMRQQLREKQALAASDAPGSVGAGRAYFLENCATCHNGAKDLHGIVARSDDIALRARLLRPTVAGSADQRDLAARRTHLRLLESFEPADMANLIAYLRHSKGVLPADLAKALVPPPRAIGFRVERDCSVCHGPAGSGGDRAPALVNNANVAALDHDGLKAILKNGLPGGMPAFPFNDAELEEYATWLKAHSPTP